MRREQRLGPHVVLGVRVAVEEAAHEGNHRDALQLAAALLLLLRLLPREQRLEAVRVPQRVRRERGDDLAEAHIAIGEGRGLALGAEEDRADDRATPTDRHDHDRAHVAKRVDHFGTLVHRVRAGVGDEHRLAALERALELRIAIEIDDEIADRRILVRGDESNALRIAGEVDRAAVEAEGLAELAGDGAEGCR